MNEPPPAAELSAEIVAQLASQGVRVTRAGSTTLCDIWLCRSLPTTEGFQAASDVLFGFPPGQLVGVVRFARRGSDFRDQTIATGTYTLRYAQQPVDGAHVGTSPTRDFLLLSKAAQDRSPEVAENKNLAKMSADAAGSNHPLMFCLQTVPAETSEFPSIREDTEREWWIVDLQARTAGADSRPLPVGVVVVGVAVE